MVNHEITCKLCHNSAIFEDVDFEFCTHILQPLPFNIYSVFILIFRGKFKKEKRSKFPNFSEVFKNSKI